MKYPLISIIVPCYNVEKYLDRCVESLLTQSYPNIEVILVDDGSNDSTSLICDNYNQQYNNIVVIHQLNQGLSIARNEGIKIAKGEFLTFVDSDDFVSVDYVLYLYDLLVDTESDISISSYQYYYENNNIDIPKQTNIIIKTMSPCVAVEKMFYQELFDTTAWGKLYRAKYFSDIIYPSHLLFEDLPTTYKLLLKSNKVVVSNYQSYYYLLRNDSIEGSAFSEQKYKSMLAIISQLENDSSLDVVRKATNCRIFSFVFRIYMSMPNSDSRKKKLWRIIVDKRLSVLKDKKARRKAKYAALLSYLGSRMTTYIYKKVKTR